MTGQGDGARHAETAPASPAIAVSTWSLHRALGLRYLNSPANDVADAFEDAYGPAKVDLLDLPAALRKNGIDRIEIVHVHMRSRDPAYLAEVKASLAQSGVRLQTLLIDAGDIADPVNRERDISWIGAWIDAAAALGADQARVSGGRQKPTRAALDLAVDGLRRLSRRGAEDGVRVVTENWQELTAGPEAVHYLLDGVNGDIGLIADFANWKGATKYDDLASIMPRATSTHAAASFPAPGVMDRDDYARCLDIAAEAGLDGPHTLIYSGPGDDEWAGLRIERDFVRERLTTNRTEQPAARSRAAFATAGRS
ncbi:MAG: sugar phosphate isomerase/epimerase family protein [Propylenella sp.]